MNQASKCSLVGPIWMHLLAGFVPRVGVSSGPTMLGPARRASGESGLGCIRPSDPSGPRLNQGRRVKTPRTVWPKGMGVLSSSRVIGTTAVS